jgi:alkanesulfonate monooxygenase SsuD/methylene tetrahydromethanopterin reductase-like flavin-dependent oxidoreductase (luciferase family)
MDTCFAYGRNPSQLRERYYEAHDLIMEAWQNPDTFTFNGRFNQLRYVNVWPRPVQKPHPPVWIPGGGSIETWRWCAEKDYVYSYLSYFGYKLAEGTMKGFWNEMKQLGKEPNPYRAGFLQFVAVANSREEAIELYREPAEYFYQRCLHVDPRWAQPPGYTTESTLRSQVTSQVALAAKRSVRQGGASSAGISMEEIVERAYLVVGSPDEVAEQLRHVATELGVGHMMLLLQFGNMGRQLTLHNTELFAKQVLPQLRDLFDDEWEDRWWPAPLPAGDRVVPETALA